MLGSAMEFVRAVSKWLAEAFDGGCCCATASDTQSGELPHLLRSRPSDAKVPTGLRSEEKEARLSDGSLITKWAVKHTSGRDISGREAACDVMAVAPLPCLLKYMPAVYPGAVRICREDLSSHVGGQLAFLVHRILTPAEANMVIEISEFCGFTEAAPDIATPLGMRVNLAVHWVAPRFWIDRLFQRLRPHLPQRVDGQRLLGLSCRLNMYKYLQNMHFKPHVDGDWPAYSVDASDRLKMVIHDRSTHGHSKLSMLLYLNDGTDGVLGGTTRLFPPRHLSMRSFEVEPAKGSALFFRHGTGADSVLHEGCPVLGERPKYVARINVMYEAEADVRLD